MSRKQTLCLIALSICGLCPIGGEPTQVAAQADTEKRTGTVQELQPQLIAAAAEGRRLAQAQFGAGVGSPEELNIWTTRWIHARLLAASDKQSRIAILTEGVKAAEEWERNVQGQHAAGMAKSTDLASARYLRIQAEMDLAAEQGK